MKLVPFYLAATLSIAIAGCNQKPADSAGASTTTAGAPAAPAAAPAPAVDRGNVDFVELPLDGSSNQPHGLAKGEAFTGKLMAPLDGEVTGVEVQIGNYGNSSVGALSMKLCQAEACAEGSEDLSNSKDNEYFHVPLTSALPVVAGQPMQYVLTRKSGDNILAVWSYPSLDASSTVTMPDGSVAQRSLRVGFRYKKK